MTRAAALVAHLTGAEIAMRRPATELVNEAAAIGQRAADVFDLFAGAVAALAIGDIDAATSLATRAWSAVTRQPQRLTPDQRGLVSVAAALCLGRTGNLSATAWRTQLNPAADDLPGGIHDLVQVTFWSAAERNRDVLELVARTAPAAQRDDVAVWLAWYGVEAATELDEPALALDFARVGRERSMHSGSPALMSAAASTAVLAHLYRGEQALAEGWFSEARRHVNDDLGASGRLIVSVAEGMFLHQINRNADALRALTTATQLSRIMPRTEQMVLGFYATCLEELGEWPRANATLRRLIIVRHDFQRHAAHRLEETELERHRGAERLSMLVEHSGELMLVVDDDGVIRWASPAAHTIVGLSAADMIGTRLHDRDRDDIRRALSDPSLRSGPVIRRVDHHAGYARYLSVRVSDLRAMPGIDGVLIVGQDVTATHLERTFLAGQAEVMSLLNSGWTADVTLDRLANLVQELIGTGTRATFATGPERPADVGEAYPLVDDGHTLGHLLVDRSAVTVPNLLPSELIDRCVQLAVIVMHQDRSGVGATDLVAKLAEQLSTRALGLILLHIDRSQELRNRIGTTTLEDYLGACDEALGSVVGELGWIGRVGQRHLVAIPTDDGQDVNRMATSLQTVMAGAWATIERGGGRPPTVSAGTAWARAGSSFDELFQFAEVALTEAQRRGHGRFVGFDEPTARREAEAVRLESELAASITDGELMVVYQPTIALTDGRVSGLEALVRWNHPEHGPVPPHRFLPIAEAAGLLGPLGRHVLSEALYASTILAQSEIHLPISINLAASQVAEPAEVEALIEMLTEPTAVSGEIHFEVPADSLEDPDVRAGLQRLRANGSKIVLDDVGAADAGFLGLMAIDADEIKLHSRLLALATNGDVNASRTLRAISAAAVSLGLRVTGKGVEDELQEGTAREVGCTGVAGWLHAAPMTLADLLRWLAERNTTPRFDYISAQTSESAPSTDLAASWSAS